MAGGFFILSGIQLAMISWFEFIPSFWMLLPYLIAYGAGATFLVFLDAVTFDEKHQGRYCPECRYELRGAFEDGCPECGWNRV